MARDLLSDDSSESDAGGAAIKTDILRVNNDFAKRFEHNKKREELQRLEEKFGHSSAKSKRSSNEVHSESSSSSSSEDEDEEGEFATATLDSEILATLNAIKSKDPRVYDQKTTFYTEVPENAEAGKEKKDKPLFLRDYHRRNILHGENFEDEGQGNDDQPLSYSQQQDRLKTEVVHEMHNAAELDGDDSASEAGFLVKKRTGSTQAVPTVNLDVENADRDPETFLSNFMAARAWVPTERSQFQPFESDDEEEDRRAEEYEEAYNMRFEDPEKSNEKLRSHARDMAAKYSVRREEANPRKRKRELDKQKKEDQKTQLREDRARLKKLRMDEMEEKIKRVKKAAGLKTNDLLPEDWAHFIEDDWNDARWEQEMQKRFDENYYAEEDILSDVDENEGNEEDSTRSKRKPRKPKFDDDIDIKDIIPDFEEDEAVNFSLTDDENTPLRARKKSKQIKQEKKKDAKKERRIIEQLVDNQLNLELEHSLPAAPATTGFRYRETSPNSFNLTARDILMAEDSQLNQYVGLKKLASFRDTEKKQKDKKRLGKKARLRQWRLDTFGNEQGLQDVELTPSRPQEPVKENGDDEFGGVDIRGSGERKKRRRRKTQKSTEQAQIAA